MQIGLRSIADSTDWIVTNFHLKLAMCCCSGVQIRTWMFKCDPPSNFPAVDSRPYHPQLVNPGALRGYNLKHHLSHTVIIIIINKCWAWVQPGPWPMGPWAHAHCAQGPMPIGPRCGPGLGPRAHAHWAWVWAHGPMHIGPMGPCPLGPWRPKI